MSTDTNSEEVLAEAIWHVGDHEIPVQVVSINHVEIQRALCQTHFNQSAPLSAETLYGILRRFWVRNVFVSYSLPIWIAVDFESDYEPVGCYWIASEELRKFLHEYCTQTNHNEQVNWAREGF